jgi:predicted GNAT family acetyltransferase
MAGNVRDNKERHRFELEADGHVAFSIYDRADGILTIMHTEVPKALEGRGIGSSLIRGALEIARTQGLKVKAVCPFAKAYLDRHPEYADLRQ